MAAAGLRDEPARQWMRIGPDPAHSRPNSISSVMCSGWGGTQPRAGAWISSNRSRKVATGPKFGQSRRSPSPRIETACVTRVLEVARCRNW